ncbi:hypothetical protein K1T71_009622 [Dendrolimus kikuchii]|uniref:Uncharacterized protein n=1 Tax=Dendrolimus kikuchii TaxID=765133 RepID=A0ACC1CS67_9NEOP|nr:hypothetical protein K1T71_009622 [Dendrolimus kikuchii]
MAALKLRLWWVAVALLVWSPHTQCKTFTPEDIRDAMMSLVHMMRLLEDKLERHEYREKALGDQVKKMLLGLDKKHRALEPLKGMISRLDERLSNVETILLQKEEREKSTQKKTNEALESLQKSIQTLTTTVVTNMKPTKATIEDNLTTSEDTIDRRLDITDAKLDAVKIEMQGLKTSLNKDALRAVCLEFASDVNPFEKHISEAEKLLNRYELKLNEYNVTTKGQTDVVTLNEVSLADEAWHNEMAEVMKRQESEIKKIRQLLSDAESMWKDLSRKTDLQLSSNQTLEAIAKAVEDIKENEENAASKITKKVREMSEKLGGTNEDIQKSLTQSNTLTERAYGDISTSFETLRTEMQTLRKNEHVILATADNVIANKKHIDNAIHLILADVRELIHMQSKNTNRTVHERFDKIESSIVDNQVGAFTNITGKIESEMSQVWRQIGVMYSQLTANKVVLDKLSEQNDNYVNSSSTTMSKVKEEVDDISTRIVELGSNLNYALGRLSLVSQEFGQISSGLADVLGSLKGEILNVKTKLEEHDVADPGPGPHVILEKKTIPN